MALSAIHGEKPKALHTLSHRAPSTTMLNSPKAMRQA